MVAPIAIATVESVTGTVYARGADGSLRELSVGDQLFDGEVLVSSDGNYAELTLLDGQLLSSQGVDELGMSRELLVSDEGMAQAQSALEGDTPQQLIEALASGQDLSELLEPTAAGNGGGGAADSGHDFTLLGRVAEAVGTLSLAPVSDADGTPELAIQQSGTEDNAALLNQFDLSDLVDADDDANVISESAPNGSVVQITGLATDADATDTVSYSLADDYNGAFVIDPSTGVVTVKDSSLLDFETDAAPTIEITATSTDGSSSKGTFTIELSDDSVEASNPNQAVVANLVTNGSFEANTFGGSWTPLVSVDGWQDSDRVEVWNTDKWSNLKATEGSHLIELDYAGGQDWIGQELNTVAGETYALSLDARVRNANKAIGSADIEIWWGGELVAVVTDKDGYQAEEGVQVFNFDQSQWHSIELELEATTDSTSLELKESAGDSGNTHGALIDNIKVIGQVNMESVQEGSEANDILVGDDDDNLLAGLEGDDSLTGAAGHDGLSGGLGDDSLDGGLGEDVLAGGAGNDTLAGGLGADTFVWELNDNGEPGSPVADRITDFDLSARDQGGDVLDLRDLLVDEEQGELTDYLQFSSDGTDTVIEISSTGQLAVDPSAVDQTITLEGVDLGNDSAAAIQQLLNGGNLLAD